MIGAAFAITFLVLTDDRFVPPLAREVEGGRLRDEQPAA